jgi:hypothetical protein
VRKFWQNVWTRKEIPCIIKAKGFNLTEREVTAMKKDFTAKKKTLIAALAVVAICLAGGLYYYIGTLDGGGQQEAVQESTPPAKSDVTVPGITTGSEPAVSTPEPSSQPNTTGSEPGTQGKPSDGKPKTSDEATPPPTPTPAPSDKAQHDPAEAGDKNTPPTSTPKPAQESNTPKSGDKNDKGEIYVPGFGWIPDEGGGVDVEEAPNAGTGDPIGDM